MSADTRKLARTLASVQSLARELAKELETVESLAFEAHVGDRGERRSRRVDGGYLSDVGDRRFKAALKDLDAAAVDFTSVAKVILGLLRGGQGTDDRMKGTLLGDENGNGAKAELERLKRNQKQRAERGEFTPFRTEAQPSAPGGY